MITVGGLIFSTAVFAQTKFEYGEYGSTSAVNKKKNKILLASYVKLGQDKRIHKNLEVTKDNFKEFGNFQSNFYKELTEDENARNIDDLDVLNYLGSEGWEIIHFNEITADQKKMNEGMNVAMEVITKLSGQKLPPEVMKYKDYSFYGKTYFLKREIVE